MCFTQNIDTLERRAGVPGDKIVEAHGSFASHACINQACKKAFGDEDMQRAVETQVVPKCARCGSYVKPNITFFGEGVSSTYCQGRSTFCLIVESLPSLRSHDVAPRGILREHR